LQKTGNSIGQGCVVVELHTVDVVVVVVAVVVDVLVVLVVVVERAPCGPCTGCDGPRPRGGVFSRSQASPTPS